MGGAQTRELILIVNRFEDSRWWGPLSAVLRQPCFCLGLALTLKTVKHNMPNWLIANRATLQRQEAAKELEGGDGASVWTEGGGGGPGDIFMEHLSVSLQCQVSGNSLTCSYLLYNWLCCKDGQYFYLGYCLSSWSYIKYSPWKWRLVVLNNLMLCPGGAVNCYGFKNSTTSSLGD